MPSYACSPFQVLAYRKLFKKYAIGPEDKKYNVMMKDKSLIGDRKIFDTRLGQDELKQIMETMGPVIHSHIIRSIILKYDSSCTGFLDFQDFLRFMDDFHQMEVVGSTELLQYNPSFLGGNIDSGGPVRFSRKNYKTPSFASFESDVSLVPGQDDEDANGEEKEIKIKKNILIRIMDIVGLGVFSRFKLGKDGSILYESINPFIKISTTSSIKTTVVLYDQLKPEWNQDFTFTLDLPADNAFELKEWIDAHVVAIELFDHISIGNFSYVEVLARSSVPLKQLVFSLDNPYYLSLKMFSVEGFFNDLEQSVTLNLSVYDNFQENPKIIKWIDANTDRHDEDFVNNFGDRIQKDFRNEVFWGHEINSETRERAALYANDTYGFSNDKDKNLYWNYYEELLQPIQEEFPFREISIFGLDEFSNFRAWPTFIRPMDPTFYISDLEKITRNETLYPSINVVDKASRFLDSEAFRSAQWIAWVISRIVFEPREKLGSFDRKNSDKDDEDEDEKDDNGDDEDQGNNHEEDNNQNDTQASGLRTFGEEIFSTEYIEVNRLIMDLPVMSPATWLTKGSGTLLEHCILACNFFLGLGLEAYVAFGKSNHTKKCWVVTYHKLSEEDDEDSFFAGNTNSSIERDFARWTELQACKKYMEETQVVHWNIGRAKPTAAYPPVAGSPYDQIYMLFNHRQIWWNVQDSAVMNRYIFSWDLANGACWIPVIPSEKTQTIECWYSEPTIFMENIPISSYSDRELLENFVDSLQQYRNKVLLIPETSFHRKVCKYLQENIKWFDIVFGKGPFMIGEVWDKLQSKSNASKGGRKHSSDQNGGGVSILQTFRGASQTNGGFNFGAISEAEEEDQNENGKIPDIKKEISDLADCPWTPEQLSSPDALTKAINEQILEFLPPGCLWHGRIACYYHANVSEILGSLGRRGMLNAGVPFNVFGVAIKSVPLSLGTRLVYLYFGYMMDVHRAVNAEI